MFYIRSQWFSRYSAWPHETRFVFLVSNMHYHSLLQFHNLEMVIVKPRADIQSDIEPEHDNIAILHLIGFTFQPDGSVFAGGGIAAGIY